MFGSYTKLRFEEKSLTVCGICGLLSDLHFFLCPILCSHVLTLCSYNCLFSNTGEVACRFFFRSFLLLYFDFGEGPLPDIRFVYHITKASKDFIFCPLIRIFFNSQLELSLTKSIRGQPNIVNERSA